MTDEREQSSVDEALETLPILDVPAGFADRVMQAHERPARDPEQVQALGSRVRSITDHRVVKWGAAAVVAAAGVLSWHAFSGSGASPKTGSLTAESRQTARLGQRGVAVAEAGAAITWTVDGLDAASVTQNRGNVFYRVDAGGAFKVQTPRGVVTVTGTCFRVEIIDMKRDKLKAAAIGAALASAVVVTVYEGGVLFADDGESGAKVELEAGQRLVVDETGARHAPAAGDVAGQDESAASAQLAPPPEGATREQLLERDQAQRKQIAKLREQLEGGSGASRSRRGATDPDGRPWFDPSEQTLAKFAEECRVRYDLPPFDMTGDNMQLPKEITAGMALTDEELAGMKRSYLAIRDGLVAEVRELYIEATGDVQGADSLSMSAMGQELQHKSSRSEAGRIHKTIARERAGLGKPPVDLSKRSPLERYYRLLGGAGDAMEDSLAQVIGTKRARELRTEMGGWGSRMEYAGCADDDEDADVTR